MWVLLRPKHPQKIQKPKYLTKKTKNSNSLKVRQGHTNHVCTISGSNSQKRCGHWHLKEFWVSCLNQRVVDRKSPFLILPIRLHKNGHLTYANSISFSLFCLFGQIIDVFDRERGESVERLSELLRAPPSGKTLFIHGQHGSTLYFNGYHPELSGAFITYLSKCGGDVPSNEWKDANHQGPS